MVTGEIDLKTLLEHDYKMIQAITSTSKLLIYELDANHYWVTQSISLFNQLNNISTNVNSLLDSCEQFWVSKDTAFSNTEAVKLWKTAAGLWSALPKEQKKFDDYAARKRRERIMGLAEDETQNIEKEQMISTRAEYDDLLEVVESTCTRMLERIASLPDGLVPKAQADKAPAGEQKLPDDDNPQVEDRVSQAEIGSASDSVPTQHHAEPTDDVIPV